MIIFDPVGLEGYNFEVTLQATLPGEKHITRSCDSEKLGVMGVETYRYTIVTVLCEYYYTPMIYIIQAPYRITTILSFWGHLCILYVRVFPHIVSF